MKNYDLMFSIGFSCGASQALRAAGLQFASLPLDWVGSPDPVAGAKLIAEDFAGWFEREDFTLVDVRHGSGFCTRAYLNRRTQIGYSHEFSDFEPFEKTFPQVKQMYDRCTARFIELMSGAKSACAVFLERPTRERIADEELVEARRLITARYPGLHLELIYVYVEPGVAKPIAQPAPEGITVLGYDYRKFDHGEVTHFVAFAPLAEYLAKAYAVADMRSEAERREYAAVKSVGSKRWGPHLSRTRRWLNKMAYKLYRELERRLIERGLVQREGPLWFWE